MWPYDVNGSSSIADSFKVDMLGSSGLAGREFNYLGEPTKISGSNGYWNSDTPLGINIGSPVATTNAYDVAIPDVKAPSFSDSAYSTELPNSVVIDNSNTGGGFMDWIGTDSAKNAIGLGGLAFTGFGAVNNYRAGQQAKKQWEAENARANEIMAMNREKYATYKADRERLSREYSGSGLASSGVANG